MAWGSPTTATNTVAHERPLSITSERYSTSGAPGTINHYYVELHCSLRGQNEVEQLRDLIRMR